MQPLQALEELVQAQLLPLAALMELVQAELQPLQALVELLQAVLKPFQAASVDGHLAHLQWQYHARTVQSNLLLSTKSCQTNLVDFHLTLLSEVGDREQLRKNTREL